MSYTGKLSKYHYVGTARNGVASRDWTGSWHRNFRVFRLTQARNASFHCLTLW